MFALLAALGMQPASCTGRKRLNEKTDISCDPPKLAKPCKTTCRGKSLTLTAWRSSRPPGKSRRQFGALMSRCTIPLPHKCLGKRSPRAPGQKNKKKQAKALIKNVCFRHIIFPLPAQPRQSHDHRTRAPVVRGSRGPRGPQNIEIQ